MNIRGVVMKLTKKDIQEWLKQEPGKIDLKHKVLYTYEPECEEVEDVNGIKTGADYLCSTIVDLRKYSNTRYLITTIPLPKTFNGKPVNSGIYSDYDWRNRIVSNFDLLDMDFSENYKDVIKEEK